MEAQGRFETYTAGARLEECLPRNEKRALHAPPEASSDEERMNKPRTKMQSVKCKSEESGSLYEDE